MSGHLNELVIARHLSGEQSVLERWRMSRHLRNCDTCQGRLETIRKERAAFDAAPERSDEIMALAAAVPRGKVPQRKPVPWLQIAVPAAAVLMAVIGAYFMLGPDEPQTDTLRPKGADIFVVYLKKGDTSTPLPETCRSGDVLRAKIRSPRPFVFVVGVDGTGTVSPLMPFEGDRSMALGDEAVWSPGSWVVDDTPGHERFVAAFSETAMSLDQVAAAIADEPERQAHKVDGLVLIEHRCKKVKP